MYMINLLLFPIYFMFILLFSIVFGTTYGFIGKIIGGFEEMLGMIQHKIWIWRRYPKKAICRIKIKWKRS